MSNDFNHLLWPPCVADADIMFLPCGFFFFLSSIFPRLISAVTHWIHIGLAYNNQGEEQRIGLFYCNGPHSNYYYYAGK